MGPVESIAKGPGAFVAISSVAIFHAFGTVFASGFFMEASAAEYFLVSFGVINRLGGVFFHHLRRKSHHDNDRSPRLGQSLLPPQVLREARRHTWRCTCVLFHVI